MLLLKVYVLSDFTCGCIEVVEKLCNVILIVISCFRIRHLLSLWSALHPCWGAVFSLRTELIWRTPGIRPEGHWTIKACLLPCCAKVLAEDRAVVVVVEPNSLWVFPDSPAPAWVQQDLPEPPRAVRWAWTTQMSSPPTQTTSCSWSATCASLLTCFCNSKRCSTPKVC